MSQTSQIQLKTSCVKTIPLHVYDKDFSFIVNGEEFKTSKFAADLLSPIISQHHLNDPTLDTFIINTQQRGNFSHFLQLFNFEVNNLPTEELPFFQELIEILGIKSIEYQNFYEKAKITIDNVFTLLKFHEQHSEIYHNRFCAEIEFIASHFSELCKDHERSLEELSIDTLLMIISSDQLKLESEDQLLRFVNDLYEHNVKYSILYETIYYENVSSDVMKEFTSIFDINMMTSQTWRRLAKRLEEETKSDVQGEMKRYKKAAVSETNIELSDDNESEGIIDQTRQASNNLQPKDIGNILSNFVYIIGNVNDFKGAIESVQPVTAIDNFGEMLKNDEDMFKTACYAVWGFCIAKHDRSLSPDMQIKVGNFLNWANIVLLNKELMKTFIDHDIFPYFPKTVNQFLSNEEFNYDEIADILEYFFPKY